MSASASSSRHAPCPRCNHTDGWCWTFAESGDIACRRDSTGTPRIDRRNVPYWVFPPDPNYTPPDPIDLPTPRRRTSTLTPDQQHQGYSALLPILTLTSYHREGLRARGLDHEDISLAGYRTMPQPWQRAFKIGQLTAGRLPRTLKMTFSEAAEIIPNLAGFYWSEHANPQTRDMSDLRMGGPPGILIPIRDLTGRIRANQIRVDDQYRTDSEGRDLGKYRFFSDSRGPKPDYFCHVPAPHFRPDASHLHTVRLTEGPLKADVATAHGGVLTLGVPGVDFWPHFLPVLAEVRPAVVQIAWDMDANRKLRVAETLRDLADGVRNAGHAVELLVWDESLGKGIDDVLQAGHGDKVQRVRGQDTFDTIDRIVAEANANDPRAEEYRQARDEVDRRRRSFDGELPDDFDSEWFGQAINAHAAKLEARTAAERALRLPITPVEVAMPAIPSGPSIIQQAVAQAAEEARKRAEQATPLPLCPHATANALGLAYHNHDDFTCRCPIEHGLEYLATGTPFTITKRCEKRHLCRGCRLWYNYCRMVLLRRFVAQLLEAGDKLYERYVPEEQWESLRHLINDHGCLYGRVLARCDGHVYVITNDPAAGAEVAPDIALGEAAAILGDDYDECQRRALVAFSKGWGEANLPKPDPKATYVGEIEWHTREVADQINEQGDIEETLARPHEDTDPVIRQRVYRRRGGWTDELREWFWACKKSGICLPDNYRDVFDSLGARRSPAEAEDASTPWDQPPGELAPASPAPPSGPSSADWLPD